MTTDLGHGRGWMEDNAAHSVFRIDAALGRPLDVNSAGRTRAEQLALLARWKAGGKYNRPPYLYQPAEHSPHETGLALDTDDQSWMRANGPAYGFLHDVPSDAPHFVYHIDRDTHRGSSAPAASQTTKDRQNFLNVYRKEKLVVDGVAGPKTIAAYKRYQTFLKAFGYVGAVDGVWGTGTQTAHAKYYATLIPATPAPVPVGSTNPFGLSDVIGLQKVANLYGAKTALDNHWGPKSAAGFAKFLSTQWGGHMATWLRVKYGYVGNDVYGPIMRAALARANAANKAAL